MTGENPTYQEMQATIARLEALLREAAPWLDDGSPRSDLRARIEAALSPVATDQGEGPKTLDTER